MPKKQLRAMCSTIELACKAYDLDKFLVDMYKDRNSRGKLSLSNWNYNSSMSFLSVGSSAMIINGSTSLVSRRLKNE